MELLLRLRKPAFQTEYFRGDIKFTAKRPFLGESHLRVTAGDQISAKYRDHTLPPPHGPGDQIPIFGTTGIEDVVDPPPSPDATITLDRTEYTWTDKVRVTVTSAAHNRPIPIIWMKIGANESESTSYHHSRS